MTDSQGFWSYVSHDDETERGRIVRLAHDIVARYEMITSQSIKLFLDKGDIDWGDDWQSKIDESLASVAFFISVITPRYFDSPQCRRELEFFSRQMELLKISPLLMPILYLEVPEMMVDSPDDSLMARVKKIHWVDWTTLRFYDLDSREYREAVAKLAARLVKANETVERNLFSQTPVNLVRDANLNRSDRSTSDLASGDIDDKLGVIERMAASFDALDRYTEILSEIDKAISGVATLTTDATTALYA